MQERNSWFKPEEVGYIVPTEILEGDFRQLEGGPDPYAEFASRLVTDKMEEPTSEVFEMVYLETTRMRRAFAEIQAQGENISPDAYWYVGDLFRSRIHAILRGETDLPTR